MTYCILIINEVVDIHLLRLHHLTPPHTTSLLLLLLLTPPPHSSSSLLLLLTPPPHSSFVLLLKNPARTASILLLFLVVNTPLVVCNDGFLTLFTIALSLPQTRLAQACPKGEFPFPNLLPRI
jgi:hypothetical protein